MHLKSFLNRVEPLNAFVHKEQRLIESEGGSRFWTGYRAPGQWPADLLRLR